MQKGHNMQKEKEPTTKEILRKELSVLAERRKKLLLKDEGEKNDDNNDDDDSSSSSTGGSSAFAAQINLLASSAPKEVSLQDAVNQLNEMNKKNKKTIGQQPI